jgi:hypothetical protein
LYILKISPNTLYLNKTEKNANDRYNYNLESSTYACGLPSSLPWDL